MTDTVHRTLTLAQAPAARPRRRRRASVARILKDARRAGYAVDRVVINPTGHIVVVMGSGEARSCESENNPWDEVLIDAADEERSA
jgi:hypothetical protein